MDYNAPTGSTDSNAPYVGKTSSTQGSRVPPRAAEYPQREIVNVELAAGLTPTNNRVTQLAQAMSIGLLVGTFGGTANALTATIPGAVVFDALLSGMTVNGFVGAGANTGAATLNLSGFSTLPGAKAIVLRDGSTPLAGGDLKAGTLISLRYDGAKFRITSMVGSDVQTVARTRLTANTTYFIDPTVGSDTTGKGTTALPWATLLYGYNFVAANFELSGYTVTLQIVNAAPSTTVVTVAGLMCGTALSGSLVVSGDTTAGGTYKDSYVITPAPAIAGQARYCVASAATQVLVQGVQMDATTASGNTRTAWATGGKIFVQDVTFRCAVNNTSLIHLESDSGGSTGYGGGIKFLGASGASTTILSAILAQAGGSFSGATSASPATVTNVNVDVTGGAWAEALDGFLSFNNTTFAGAATGPRYYSALNGVIQSNGLTLPGSSAGSTTLGGQYT